MCIALDEGCCICSKVPRVCAAGAGVEFRVADRIGMAAYMLPFCVAMCVNRCGSVTADCKTHCNGSMDVAGALFWEVVWARNLVFFSGKVAPAGDERYLVCAAVAAGGVPGSIGSSSAFCNDWCVVCT